MAVSSGAAGAHLAGEGLPFGWISRVRRKPWPLGGLAQRGRGRAAGDDTVGHERPAGAVPAEAGMEKHLPAFLQRAVDETADQPALLGPGLRFVADVQPEEGKRRDSKEGCRPPGREMNDRRDAGLAGEVVPVIGDVGASASVDAIVDPGHAASLRRGEEYTPGEEFGVSARPRGPGDGPAVMSHPGGQWSRN